VSLYGLEKAKLLAKEYIDKAIDYLMPYEEKYKILEQIALYTLERVK
jgi:hypothetical protein